MQDGALIHTAHIMGRWFADNAIEEVGWPPYSPDLNLIKHVWRHLRNGFNEHPSELEILTSEDEMIKECMMKTLQEDWTALKDELFENLVVLMKKQFEIILKTEN